MKGREEVLLTRHSSEELQNLEKFINEKAKEGYRVRGTGFPQNAGGYVYVLMIREVAVEPTKADTSGII